MNRGGYIQYAGVPVRDGCLRPSVSRIGGAMASESGQHANRSVWPWVLGGAAIVSIAGLACSGMRGRGPFARDHGVSFRHSIHVDVPVEKAFNFMRDPLNWESLHPAFAVRDANLTPEFVGSSLAFAVVEHRMRFEGRMEWTEFVPNERIGIKETGFCEGAYAWTFEPEGQGTKITTAGEYTHARVWPIPLAGRVWEWLVLKGEAREAKAPLRMVKARLEA